MMTLTNDINNSLFNKEVKEKYLNEVKETTRQSYERIFKITQKFEEMLNKDINHFTKSEMETVLISFKANNRNTLENYSRIISSYLNWSIKHKIINKNILSDFKPTDFEKYLIEEEKYIPENKIRRYEDRCENFQDAVIIRLLFIGVGGRKMSEIRNLKKEDVNYDTMELKLKNSLKEDEFGNPIKYTERYLKIDERTIYLIQGAISEEVYVKKNGFMEQIENIRPYTELINNNYIIRPSITKTETFNRPVDKHVIYRRIAVLSETLGIEDLTSKFIQRSGMMYFVKNLIQENEITIDDIKMIANRFNVKSYHNLKGFLTIDNINKTYNRKE